MITSCFFYVDETGKLHNAKGVRKAFELKKGNYQLKIESKSKRSLKQNAYYWACCLPIVQEGFKELGHELTLEEVHDFLKARFNFKEVVNFQTGEVIQIPKSTTELSKDEFGEYISRIQQFAAEFLHRVIPDPNSQTTIF